jgi:serine beta-lactamase-like protein LACTB, mitochondrial
MKSRTQTWLAVIVLGIGAVLAAILGLFAYVSATATPIHPDAQQVPSSAQSAPLPKWSAAVERGRQVAREGLASQNLPGVSVAVGIGGDIVWAEGFGYSDLEKRSIVTPETRFRIGDASIALTSAAAGLLLEKNRLKLDDEIQTYVPDFPKKQWPMTLRQVMGHVAGIRNDAGDEEPLLERCDQTTDGLRRFANDRLLFEPGTRYRYSSYGWILASAAIDRAAAEPLFAFMRTQIFEPLGMDSTRPDAAMELIPHRTTFYFPRFAGDTRYGPELAREGDHTCFAGAGAFLSTPSDLVRFGMAFHSGKLLKPATVEMLQTPQRLASGEQTEYGLGWKLETVSLAGHQTRMAGHGTKADFIGTTAYLMTFPERGLVVAVTANTSFADAYSLALKIAEPFAEQGKD